MDYTWKEMMAIAFARDLQDWERVTSGAHTEISFAATMLAQKLHAPNLKLQLGGTCFLCNVSGIDDVELPLTSTDYRIMDWAEGYYDHPETFHMYGPPGGDSYYTTDTFRKTNKWWFADKFFVGGIQADRRGNVNLIGLGKDGNFTLRGPGTIGINDIVVGVTQEYIFLTNHDRARLVERVDYISMPGRAICREMGFPGGGPKWIVTPRCVFDFDEADQARLHALFPGHTEEEIRRDTGFEFQASPDLFEVPPPTEEELSVLRTQVDPRGVLRG